VNDGTLLTNISENAQQSFGTYKIGTITQIILCFVIPCPRMSKQLTLSGVAYRRLTANREKNLTKYSESIDAYIQQAEKNRKSN